MRVSIALVSSSSPVNTISEELSRKSASLSVGNPIILNGAECVPHVSIFQLDVERHRLGELKDIVKSILQTHRHIQLKFSGVELENKNWLFWSLEFSQRLKELHEEIVTRCAPIRRANIELGGRGKYLDGVAGLMHERYGYPHVMELYKPHITLQVIQRSELERSQIQELLGKHAGVEWQPTHVIIAEVGPQGRISRTGLKAALKLPTTTDRT